jgi:type VI secretion system secreted protein VgrG
MSISTLLKALLGNQALFTLDIGGVDADIRVVRFNGQEGISDLFRFRLEIAGPYLDIADLVDKPALVTIQGLETPRFIHGVLSEVEYAGHARDQELYEVDLVPWIWKLQHREDCRIFQAAPTRKILEAVLTGAGLPKDLLRFDLMAEYKPRDYCVQYHESDYAFISRLMEEDGMFFFFEHFEDKHVLVIADHPRAHPPIGGIPAIYFNAGGEVTDREHVRELRFGQRIKPGKHSLRDFNLHAPDQKMEVNEAAKVHAELEVYNNPGDYQDPGAGQAIARTRLEAHQAMRRSGTGVSDCPRLTAGHLFQLIGHHRDELDTTYRLVSVVHTGKQPQVLDQDATGEFEYHNRFIVNEKSQPYRTPQRTLKPRVRGLQTATVVGPEGEEVHPDEHARVKVQFHWDRSEPFDETSSCWVRVSQLWAGNGWGAMFIPRIGHEVLVDFIEGDPDRPVVVGRLYTGNNRPPYPLPAEKTKSTIKSESSIGGGGFNEFRYEDRKGSEEIFLHAQKDWNTFTINCLTETVGNNRTSSIGNSETISVGNNRTVTVKNNDHTTVGVEHKVTIAPPPPVVIQFPAVPFVPPPPPIVIAIPPTTVTMREQFIELSTGYATITIDGPDISLEADGNIKIAAKGKMDVSAASGDLTIKGGPMVKINC